jgi:hypothetical protein
MTWVSRGPQRPMAWKKPRATADPYGMTNKRTGSANGNGNSSGDGNGNGDIFG